MNKDEYLQRVNSEDDGNVVKIINGKLKVSNIHDNDKCMFSCIKKIIDAFRRMT